MLLKWIVCSVPDETRHTFSVAQRAWSKLSGVEGFLAQVGGWDLSNPERACILGVWQSEATYQAFMTSVHDQITDTNNQEKSYTSSTVTLFALVSEVGDFVASLHTAGVVRAARCVVHPKREQHFVATQLNHWWPGMSCVSGFKAGLFSKREATPEYLVTTAWADMESHRGYKTEHFAKLRAAADVEQDVALLDGALFRLEAAWTVT